MSKRTSRGGMFAPFVQIGAPFLTSVRKEGAFDGV